MGDKDITGDNWKKIWRQKRDAFLKKRKELYGQSGSAAKSVYKGPLYDQMLFLCDHIPVPSTVSNLVSDSQDLFIPTDADHETDSQGAVESDTVSVLSRYQCYY
ncbi:hypothetical protein PoB_005256500 [Plakobranchus ocellatus]|uniref:MADF domain-containing protein n=1 Tax=Plakobranchus ocellatus TaxID=259542 RepID=A0AAV4C350_9GAST|nr:hypothetical protein PoB_005256500 [Plakobranchus ocellatus]